MKHPAKTETDPHKKSLGLKAYSELVIVFGSVAVIAVVLALYLAP
jgi:hypothetical protein